MKIITNIDCPDEWLITNNFGSHKPILWLALKNVSLNIIEFGVGLESTPLLVNWSNKNKRQLVSLENNHKWAAWVIKHYKQIQYGKINAYMKNKHIVLPVRFYTHFSPSQNSLCFIDSAPASTRIKILKGLKNENHLFIIHDTEEMNNHIYGLSEILSTFKYRLDYRPIGFPYTSAVSNFINTEKWI